MRALFLASLLLFSGSAHSAVLKFCYEDWEPYAKQEGNKSVGISIDLLNEALVELGHSASYEQIQSSKRCTKEVEDGTLDGMLFESKTGEQKKYIIADVPTEYWVISVIVNESYSGNQFKDFADFKGKVFGAVSGYEYPEEVSKHQKEWKQDEVVDAISNLRKISGGRVFFTTDDPAWAKAAAKKEGLKVKVLEPSVTYDPTYVALAKKHAKLMKDLNKKLEEMKAKGRFDEVYKKYIGVDLATFKKANNIE